MVLDGPKDIKRSLLHGIWTEALDLALKWNLKCEYKLQTWISVTFFEGVENERKMVWGDVNLLQA